MTMVGINIIKEKISDASGSIWECLDEVEEKLHIIREKLLEKYEEYVKVLKELEELRKLPHAFGWLERRKVRNKVGQVYEYWYYCYYDNGSRVVQYIGSKVPEKLIKMLERGKEIRRKERELKRIEKEINEMVKSIQTCINYIYRGLNYLKF